MLCSTHTFLAVQRHQSYFVKCIQFYAFLQKFLWPWSDLLKVDSRQETACLGCIATTLLRLLSKIHGSAVSFEGCCQAMPRSVIMEGAAFLRQIWQMFAPPAMLFGFQGGNAKLNYPVNNWAKPGIPMESSALELSSCQMVRNLSVTQENMHHCVVFISFYQETFHVFGEKNLEEIFYAAIFVQNHHHKISSSWIVEHQHHLIFYALKRGGKNHWTEPGSYFQKCGSSLQKQR